MKQVFKYTLDPSLGDVCMIDMPLSAHPIHVAEQYGSICLWAVVDGDTSATESRIFRIAGTGHEMDHEDIVHIGTVLLANGSLVFHVFEVLDD